MFIFRFLQGKILMQGTYQELSTSDLDFGKLLGSVEESEKEQEEEDIEDITDEDIPFIDGVRNGKLLKSSSSIQGRSSLSCAVCLVTII